MSRKTDKALSDGISVRLCFRPSTIAGNAGRLYYRIIIRRVCHSYNSDYTISATEWDNASGIIREDAVSPRGKELLAIMTRTKWEIYEMMTIAKKELERNDDASFDTIVAEFEASRTKQSFTAFCQKQAERLVSANRVRTSETYLSTYKSFMRFRSGEDIMLYEFDTSVIVHFELVKT